MANEIKRVTMDMIDDTLACSIAAWSKELHDPTREQIIAFVLAWLANNPEGPATSRIQEILSKRWGIPPDDIAPNMVVAGFDTAVEWNRTRFLKKEEPLPSEVQVLLWNKNQLHIGDIHESHNRAVLKAWKLGKELECDK